MIEDNRRCAGWRTAVDIGATKDRHVDDAVAAVAVELTDKEPAFLAEPYRPREVRL
ncbi:hypothetical protein ACWENQ_10845 [Nonomuraea sp. NPDC004354]